MCFGLPQPFHGCHVHIGVCIERGSFSCTAIFSRKPNRGSAACHFVIRANDHILKYSNIEEGGRGIQAWGTVTHWQAQEKEGAQSIKIFLISH